MIAPVVPLRATEGDFEPEQVFAPTCGEHGTCEPSCPMYGWCHCNCGERTTKPVESYVGRGYDRNHYHRYRWQHWRPYNPYDGDKCAVRYEEVAGMVQALWDEYGLKGTAKRVGVSIRCVSMWHNGHYKHVQRATAKKIEKAWEAMSLNLLRTKVSMAPLRQYFRDNGLVINAVWPEPHPYQRQIQREWGSLLMADDMATSLGLHPYQIWGPGWYDL